MDEAQIVNGFWRAAYGEIAWESAIDALAVPLGSQTGQLAIVDPAAGIVAAIFTRLTSADLRDIASHRVYLPSVNPRIHGLLDAPPGQVVTDDDFLSPSDQATLPVYRDFFRPSGRGRATSIRSLDTIDGAHIALSLVGNDNIANRVAGGHDLLRRVLPALSGAAQVAIRFGRLQADAMVTALEQDRRPSIALRRDRVPVALSAGAERLLSQNQYLTQRRRRLHATDRRCDDRLASAIEQIERGDPAALRRRLIVLRSAVADDPPIIASLVPVVERSGSFSEAVAMLTMADTSIPDDLPSALTDAYGLTPTEAVITVAIAQGQSPSEIATVRGLSKETVRTHLRSIMGKTDTHRQSELVALMRRIGG